MGPLLSAASACDSSSGVPRAARLSSGRSWAHSGAVRAPCRRLDQVRGGHEKGCAGQAGGEDRCLRGGRRGWSEGRGGDGVRTSFLPYLRMISQQFFGASVSGWRFLQDFFDLIKISRLLHLF